jgi:FAD/FMN-containing dehydrogenase
MPDFSDIQDTVRSAADSGTPLLIQGGNSKSFYGRKTRGETLSLGDYCGIIDYTPSELVISVRAGTLLADLEAVLEQEGQMLGFEPPRFGDNAGPRRPYTGAARDFVLGVNCINGKGELLRLGGRVMKNVAGYDLSRTLTGSLGTLAILLDIHIKVLPQPETEITLQQDCSAESAVQRCNRWAGLPLPLSGTCHVDGQLNINCLSSRMRNHCGACQFRPLRASSNRRPKAYSTGVAHSAGSGVICRLTIYAASTARPADMPPCSEAVIRERGFFSRYSHPCWPCTSASKIVLTPPAFSILAVCIRACNTCKPP